MTFAIQSAEGRIFFVNTTNGYLWEVGPDQSMTRVVDLTDDMGIPKSDKPTHFPVFTEQYLELREAADRAAVVGTATREIDGRTFVGQFQPDDDEQSGDINGPGTLTISEKMGVGQFKLRFEGAVLLRAVAWQMFDTWEPDTLVIMAPAVEFDPFATS